jgi:hypothetical protein
MIRAWIRLRLWLGLWPRCEACRERATKVIFKADKRMAPRAMCNDHGGLPASVCSVSEPTQWLVRFPTVPLYSYFWAQNEYGGAVVRFERTLAKRFTDRAEAVTVAKAHGASVVRLVPRRKS